METLKTLAFLLMIPLLGTAGLLLIAGKGDGEFRETSIVTVDHPQELVYEWLSEPARRPKWVSGLESCRVAEGRRVETGAWFEERLEGSGERSRRRVEVLDAVWGEALELRIAEEGRTVDVRYELSRNRSRNRTRIDVTVQGTVEGWWARLIEPILVSRLVGSIDDDLERLGVAVRDA